MIRVRKRFRASAFGAAFVSLLAAAGSAQELAPEFDPLELDSRERSLDHFGASDAKDGANTPGLSLAEEGFNSAIEQVFPMTPEMVRRYLGILEENERASAETPEPAPISGAEMIAFDPSSAPPRIHVAPGIATAVGFYDSTGSPWPVRQYVLGDGERFEVIQLGEGSNTLTVSALSRFGWTNLVVALADEPSPVVLRIKVGRDQAHYRTNIQVAKPGPEAASDYEAALEEPSFPSDPNLRDIVGGLGPVVPAVDVPVRGVDASAWLVGEDIYIRSKHALLSPAWSASLSGLYGVRAYKVPLSSVLLFSIGGRIIRADLDLP